MRFVPQHILLGLYRAILEDSSFQPACYSLAAAVDDLRAGGDMGYLPRGLITRAWLCFAAGDTAGAQADLDEAWQIAERGVRGAPDFVVEVLSPSTAGHDQVNKRRVYERHGVREYWLVHPTDRVLTVYRLLGSEYGRPDVQELTGETPIGALPGLTILWDALATRLPRPEFDPGR